MDKIKPAHWTFHSFCIKPAYYFENQQRNEEIILVLRAHPVTQIPWIFNSLIFLLIVIPLNLFIPSFLSFAQIFLFDLFSLTAILAYIWFNFLGWFFNLGVVTNKRIIDIDYHAVIYKEVTETNLSKVEDVTTKSGGFFSSLFNYGTVFVQTAGTEVNIEFFDIPRPAEVTKIINHLVPVEK